MERKGSRCRVEESEGEEAGVRVVEVGSRGGKDESEDVRRGKDSRWGRGWEQGR